MSINQGNTSQFWQVEEGVIQGQAGKPFYHTPGKPLVWPQDIEELDSDSLITVQMIKDNKCLCEFKSQHYFRCCAVLSTQKQDIPFLQTDEETNRLSVVVSPGHQWKFWNFLTQSIHEGGQPTPSEIYQYLGCCQKMPDVGKWKPIKSVYLGTLRCGDSPIKGQVVNITAPSVYYTKQSQITGVVMQMIVSNYKCCNGEDGCGLTHPYFQYLLQSQSYEVTKGQLSVNDKDLSQPQLPENPVTNPKGRWQLWKWAGKNYIDKDTGEKKTQWFGPIKVQSVQQLDKRYTYNSFINVAQEFAGGGEGDLVTSHYSTFFTANNVTRHPMLAQRTVIENYGTTGRGIVPFPQGQILVDCRFKPFQSSIVLSKEQAPSMQYQQRAKYQHVAYAWTFNAHSQEALKPTITPNNKCILCQGGDYTFSSSLYYSKDQDTLKSLNEQYPCNVPQLPQYKYKELQQQIQSDLDNYRIYHLQTPLAFACRPCVEPSTKPQPLFYFTNFVNALNQVRKKAITSIYDEAKPLRGMYFSPYMSTNRIIDYTQDQGSTPFDISGFGWNISNFIPDAKTYYTAQEYVTSHLQKLITQDKGVSYFTGEAVFNFTCNPALPYQEYPIRLHSFSKPLLYLHTIVKGQKKIIQEEGQTKEVWQLQAAPNTTEVMPAHVIQGADNVYGHYIFYDGEKLDTYIEDEQDKVTYATNIDINKLTITSSKEQIFPEIIIDPSGNPENIKSLWKTPSFEIDLSRVSWIDLKYVKAERDSLLFNIKQKGALVANILKGGSPAKVSVVSMCDPEKGDRIITPSTSRIQRYHFTDCDKLQPPQLARVFRWYQMKLNIGCWGSSKTVPLNTRSIWEQKVLVQYPLQLPSSTYFKTPEDGWYGVRQMLDDEGNVIKDAFDAPFLQYIKLPITQTEVKDKNGNIHIQKKVSAFAYVNDKERDQNGVAIKDQDGDYIYTDDYMFDFCQICYVYSSGFLRDTNDFITSTTTYDQQEIKDYFTLTPGCSSFLTEGFEAYYTKIFELPPDTQCLDIDRDRQDLSGIEPPLTLAVVPPQSMPECCPERVAIYWRLPMYPWYPKDRKPEDIEPDSNTQYWADLRYTTIVSRPQSKCKRYYSGFTMAITSADAKKLDQKYESPVNNKYYNGDQDILCRIGPPTVVNTCSGNAGSTANVNQCDFNAFASQPTNYVDCYGNGYWTQVQAHYKFADIWKLFKEKANIIQLTQYDSDSTTQDILKLPSPGYYRDTSFTQSIGQGYGRLDLKDAQGNPTSIDTGFLNQAYRYNQQLQRNQCNCYMCAPITCDTGGRKTYYLSDAQEKSVQMYNWQLIKQMAKYASGGIDTGIQLSDSQNPIQLTQQQAMYIFYRYVMGQAYGDIQSYFNPPIRIYFGNTCCGCNDIINTIQKLRPLKTIDIQYSLEAQQWNTYGYSMCNPKYDDNWQNILSWQCQEGYGYTDSSVSRIKGKQNKTSSDPFFVNNRSDLSNYNTLKDFTASTDEASITEGTITSSYADGFNSSDFTYTDTYQSKQGYVNIKFKTGLTCSESNSQYNSARMCKDCALQIDVVPAFYQRITIRKIISIQQLISGDPIKIKLQEGQQDKDIQVIYRAVQSVAEAKQAASNANPFQCRMYTDQNGNPQCEDGYHSGWGMSITSFDLTIKFS